MTVTFRRLLTKLPDHPHIIIRKHFPIAHGDHCKADRINPLFELHFPFSLFVFNELQVKSSPVTE